MTPQAVRETLDLGDPLKRGSWPIAFDMAAGQEANIRVIIAEQQCPRHCVHMTHAELYLQAKARICLIGLGISTIASKAFFSARAYAQTRATRLLLRVRIPAIKCMTEA